MGCMTSKIVAKRGVPKFGDSSFIVCSKIKVLSPRQRAPDRTEYEQSGASIARRDMAILACLLAGSSAWLVGPGPSTRPATAATAGRARIAELQMDEDAPAAITRPVAFVGSSFGSSAMAFRQGTLVLEDGTRLRGVSFGFEESIAGKQQLIL